jgi:hypothetical protein
MMVTGHSFRDLPYADKKRDITAGISISSVEGGAPASEQAFEVLHKHYA